MKTKHPGGLRRKALAILAGAVLGVTVSGAAAGSASAYSCVPYGGANLCTYGDGWIGAAIFRVGTWHSLQWSIAQNDQSPYNRTVYADLVLGQCGCVPAGKSQYANGYVAISGVQDNTFTHWLSAQPRSQLAYVAGGLLSQEIY